MIAIQDRIVDYFQTNSGYVYDVIRKFNVNSKDYDDIFQEAWVKAYLASNKYDFSKSPAMSGWIYTIVKNLSLDWSRNSKTRSATSLDALQDLSGFEAKKQDQYSSIEESENLQLIFKVVLNRIPVKYRQILRDRYLHQLEYIELEEKYAIQSSTARWRVHQALQLLKTEWLTYSKSLQEHGSVACLCGCGTLLLKFEKGRKRPARFARGHHKKIKARKYSEETTKCACGCGKTIYKYDRYGSLRQYYRTHGSQKENSPTKRKYNGETREIRMLQSVSANRQLYKKRALKAGIIPAKLLEKICTKCNKQKLCKFSGQFRADGSPRFNPWCVDCMKNYARIKRQFYRNREAGQIDGPEKVSTTLGSAR